MSTQGNAYRITGMSCEHCVRSVTDAVSKVAGVTEVNVDLTSGRLTVATSRPVDGAAVIAAVEEAGYEVAP